MLLINAKRNQTVLINESHRLTVRTINEDNFTVTFLYEHVTTPIREQRIIKVGVPFEVMRNVNVTVTRISVGREPIAVLGFDAPRRIPIRGEWMGKRTRKTDYVKLKAMPPAELIATATREATTDLELVLLENLQMQLIPNLSSRR